jgi:hypothetical protein
MQAEAREVIQSSSRAPGHCRLHAYQEVIDRPVIADPALALEWARTTRRLAPTTKANGRLTQPVLDDFAIAHGLSRGSYALPQAGRKHFLVYDASRNPEGADRDATAPVVPLPPEWPRRATAQAYQPRAYQEVIDNPGIADPALAWARDTKRLAPNTTANGNLSHAVLDDFAAAHGLARGSYSRHQIRRQHVLIFAACRNPGGSDRAMAAPVAPLPSEWLTSRQRPGVDRERDQD